MHATAPRHSGLVAVLALLAACAQTATPTQPSSAGSVTERPSPPAPQPTVPDTARYRVEFISTWSAATHPADFPATAHYSPLIGATHAATVSFWREGLVASEGVRRMAERGATSPLDAEIMSAIAAGTAGHVLRGPALATSPDAASMEFEASTNFPLVTLVTMVAPSPDWFVGVSGLSLIDDSGWMNDIDVPLYAFDAGTDSGATYTAADIETTPRRPVTTIIDYPIVSPDAAALPLGRFRFVRLP